MGNEVKYVQPQIEVITVEVENGFANSMELDETGIWDN